MGFFGQGMLAPSRGFGSSKFFFGSATPSRYSRQDFGPSNHLFWASSAFKLFEAGLRSLESSFSGQQCLQVIRGRTSVPQIIFFGPAAPSSCSRLGFGPSNCFLRSSNTFQNVRACITDPQNASRGYLCLHSVRIRANAFSNLSFGLSTLLIQYARILVAIYQFGCRMSNMKVSPQLATLDGPVFVSNALCRKFSIPTV
jgi:hypothetical protein